MPRTIHCPSCGDALTIPDGFVGEVARCPRCQEVIHVAAAESPDIAVAEAADRKSPAAVSASEGTSGKAIGSLVLGILSFCLWILASIPAIVLGILSLRDINRSGGRLGGSAMAILGIVLGSIGTLAVIPAILIALLLPAVNKARDAARRIESANKMKQLGLASNIFAGDHGRYPPAGMSAGGETAPLSWRVYLLPYLDEEDLFNEFHLDEPWDSPHNSALIPRMPSVYRSPMRMVDDGMTVYVAVTGPGTPFQGPAEGAMSYVEMGPLASDFGTVWRTAAETVQVVEVDADYAVTWTEPEDYYFEIAFPLIDLGQTWQGGFNALFVDGSVEFISTRTTTPEELQDLFVKP